MYDAIGECACCGKTKRCRELIVVDADAGLQYLYLFCKECDEQIEEDIKYFCE